MALYTQDLPSNADVMRTLLGIKNEIKFELLQF